MNLNKLKEAARKYEQREEWRRAIDVYLQAIKEAEDAGEGSQDPALYNRVGDLELKAGDTVAGLRAYEQAAELYAEQGFFNNAIALCQKILRVNPGRSDTYLRLAQLNARKNFVGEAKKNLLEYIERQSAVGQLDTAFNAVKIFADQFSANPDIRLMLVELLRTTSRFKEAKEQLEKLAGELEARGDSTGAQRTREKLHELDDEERAAPGSRAGDLIFLDTGIPFVPPSARDAVPGPPAEDLTFEPTSIGEGAVEEPLPPASAGQPGWDAAMEPVEGLDLGVPGADAPGDLPALDFSPRDAAFPELDVDDSALDLVSSSLDDGTGMWVEEPSGSALDDPGRTESAEGLDAAPFDDVGSLDVAPLPMQDKADMMYLQLEDTVAESDPSLGEDPGVALLQRAREILNDGDAAGGRLALQEALGHFEGEGRWDEALQVAADLVRLAPDDIAGYQKQVEIAYRTGDRSALIAAYLELAEALVRLDAVDHSVHVYRHILQHDPGNEAALAALELLTPVVAAAAAAEPVEPVVPVVPEPVTSAPPIPAPPPAAEQKPPPGPPAPAPAVAAVDSFVDLGALIMDDEQPRDTRMRIGQKHPIEDEDQAFHEALAEFKRGIDQNIDAEDFQAHYDLGIAFKEMGLIDEAIAQFQKALRSPEGRLKTSEQLGIAFFEKAQHAISEAVLRRAIDSLPGADDQKIGLLYWLGRSLEAQQRGREALPLYERALAVDIRFLDLGDRVKRLVAGVGS
jgi:tetratricopeptide (TPR) repeat protein